MNKGFTLVEMSIVLVVIGLLVGGTLVGANMIHTTELSATVEVQRKQEAAVNIFKDKYKRLPGDMKDANDYWSGANTGDGNGKIDYLGYLGGEELWAWEHLSNSGLVEGELDETLGIPKGKVDGSFYRLSFLTKVYLKQGHFISLNGIGSDGKPNTGILSPKDAHYIDMKFDDGLADAGVILGANADSVPGCVENQWGNPSYHVTHTDASYLMQNDDVVCKLFIAY